MKKNILYFWIGLATYISCPLYAQEVSTATETEHGRIEQVTEKGHNIIRFIDKDGKKIRDINVDSKESNIRISKSRPFNPSTFKVKISPKVAQDIEDIRKDSGRDISFLRRVNKEVDLSKNGKFITVEEMTSDFSEVADARDDERADGADEVTHQTIVYDLAGNEILKLNNEEGRGATVSNTGELFIVAVGEAEEKIINRKKEILAIIPYDPQIYFSKTDKYILIVHYIPEDGTGTARLYVFDTKENKLGSKQVLVPWSVFASNETPEIYEETRTLIVRHAWEPATKEAKVDTVRF